MATPSELGLAPTKGAVFTDPDTGTTWYGWGEEWRLSPMPTPDTSMTGERMLGFEPTYETVFSGSPAGTVPLDPKMYATEETADELARLFVARIVMTRGVGQAGEQRELIIEGSTARLNAGRIADKIMQVPVGSLLGIAADAGLPTTLAPGARIGQSGLLPWLEIECRGFLQIPLPRRDRFLKALEDLEVEFVRE